MPAVLFLIRKLNTQNYQRNQKINILYENIYKVHDIYEYLFSVPILYKILLISQFFLFYLFFKVSLIYLLKYL